MKDANEVKTASPIGEALSDNYLDITDDLSKNNGERIPMFTNHINTLQSKKLLFQQW